jgi:methyl-accepting chemotaxis protein
VAEHGVQVAQGTAANLKALRQNIDRMRTIESMGSRRVDALAEEEIPDRVLRIARVDHVLWKKRLADQLAGLQTLRPDELADHRSCRLGRWAGSAQAAAHHHHPAWARLHGPHEQAHAEGIAAVKAWHRGDRDEAFARYARMEAASQEVLAALEALRRPA